MDLVSPLSGLCMKSTAIPELVVSGLS
ncbi:hypothetical protein DBR06_SOUSAS13110006, partial [Sousa chinensis]